MPQVCRETLIRQIQQNHKSQRMPFVYALNKSLGWPMLSEGTDEQPTGLISNEFSLSDNSNAYFTCMSLSELGEVAAIGSGERKGTIRLARYAGPWINPNNIRLEIVHTEHVNAPVHALDWKGQQLLAGSYQGEVRLYTVHDATEDDMWHLSPVSTFTTQLPTTSVLPGTVSCNSFVNEVAFSPHFQEPCQGSQPMNASSHFLVAAAQQLAVWDIAEKQKPLWQVTTGQNPLHCASWSPHAPHTLIAGGGSDCDLKLWDTRNSQVVWRAKNAHQHPIRDVQFNPFFPYWLASAGGDGIVNIWDVRSSFHEPVGRIDGHLGAVTSIAWSTTRPEIMSTASMDGTLHLWTLSPDVFPIWDTFNRTEYDIRYPRRTYHLNEDMPWVVDLPADMNQITDSGPMTTMQLVGAKSVGTWGRKEVITEDMEQDWETARPPVVKVKASKAYPDLFYCLTGLGQLSSHTLKNHLVNEHKYDSQQFPLAHQIENDIYLRCVKDAQAHLDEYRLQINDQDSLERGKHESILEALSKDLEAPPAIQQDTWSMNSIPDMSNRRISRRLWNENDLWGVAISTFQQDLRHWANRIPPGHSTLNQFPLDLKPLLSAFTDLTGTDDRDEIATVVSTASPTASPAPAPTPSPEPTTPTALTAATKTSTSHTTESQDGRSSSGTTGSTSHHSYFSEDVSSIHSDRPKLAVLTNQPKEQSQLSPQTDSPPTSPTSTTSLRKPRLSSLRRLFSRNNQHLPRRPKNKHRHSNNTNEQRENKVVNQPQSTRRRDPMFKDH